MRRAVAPRAAQAWGVGCGPGLPRASPGAAAVGTTDIQLLRLQLPFQRRTWPTEETKKALSAPTGDKGSVPSPGGPPGSRTGAANLRTMSPEDSQNL